MCVFRQYVEKLDLSGFISITDDSSQDRNLDSARLNLHMKDENIKLTVRECVKIKMKFCQSNFSFLTVFLSSLLSLQAPNAEARELWKGFIYSVAQVCDV